MKRMAMILCCVLMCCDLMLITPLSGLAFADNTKEIPADLERELEHCYGYQSLKLLRDHAILTTYIDLYERVGRYDGSISSEELHMTKGGLCYGCRRFGICWIRESRQRLAGPTGV